MEKSGNIYKSAAEQQQSDSVHVVSKPNSLAVSDTTDDDLETLLNEDLLSASAVAAEDDVHWIIRGVNRIKRSLGLNSGETTKIKSRRKRGDEDDVTAKKLSKAKLKLNGKNNKSAKVLLPIRPKRQE